MFFFFFLFIIYFYLFVTVRTVRKDERLYYEALIESSIQRLMLFPYHLADMIVKGNKLSKYSI